MTCKQVVQRTQELEGVLSLILAAAAPSPASTAAASSSDVRVEMLEGNAAHTAAGTGRVTVTSPLPPALQVRVGLVVDVLRVGLVVDDSRVGLVVDDSLPLVLDTPPCCRLLSLKSTPPASAPPVLHIRPLKTNFP